MQELMNRVGKWLSGLGMRTGMIVLVACVVFYVLSFAQMALPIPVAWKGGLWVALFGMAKATQYTALLILGKEGIRRCLRKFPLKLRREGDI